MFHSSSGGRRRVFVASAALAIGGIVLANVASAALLSYEPFNYAPGSPVIGNNGGVGWTGAWTSPRPGGAGGAPVGSNSIVAGSLAGPAGLTTIGNHALFTGEFGTMDGLHRPFANIVGADGTTTWVSFLGQRQGATGTTQPNNPYARGANVSFYDSEGTTDDSNIPDERFGMGNSSNAVANEWSIIPEGAGGSREGSVNDPWSTLAWGVMRIDHHGDDEVADSAWLWIDPSPLGGEPSTATADVTIIGGAVPDTNARDFSNIDFVRPFVGNAQTNIPFAVMVIDEIRVGTAWNDMRDTGGIPEPASCVLLVFGALVMCFRGIRR